MLLAFLFGLVFALGLILPLGPQNMFVLAQGMGMRNNQKTAIAAVVITAATCDTLLILIAGFGLTLVVFKLIWIKAIFLILGVLFLAYLGWNCWQQPTNKAITEKSINSRETLKKLILITLGLSLLNPYALLDTIVTIGSMSLTYHDRHNRIIFLFACIITSWIVSVQTL